MLAALHAQEQYDKKFPEAVAAAESKDSEESWGTIGVSENIIEASWKALNDAFEYKLYKDGVANAAGGHQVVSAAH